MISVIAGVCAFFSASFVGIWMRKRCNDRAVFYKDYFDYLRYVVERINCERAVISEINADFKGKSKEFSDLLCGKEVTAPLNDKELYEIKTYISGIGRTDAETQLASLYSECSRMKKVVDEECVSLKKDGALRFKLAVLVGVVLFIVLV